MEKETLKMNYKPDSYQDGVSAVGSQELHCAKFYCDDILKGIPVCGLYDKDRTITFDNFDYHRNLIFDENVIYYGTHNLFGYVDIFGNRFPDKKSLKDTGIINIKNRYIHGIFYIILSDPEVTSLTGVPYYVFAYTVERLNETDFKVSTNNKLDMKILSDNFDKIKDL